MKILLLVCVVNMCCVVLIVFVLWWMRASVFSKSSDNFAQEDEGKKYENCGRDRFCIKAETDGDAETTHYPERRCGGEADDAAFVVCWAKDRSGADETDTGNDLRGNTCRIDTDAGTMHEVDRSYRCDGEQARSEADHDIGSQTGGFMMIFAFDPDQSRENHTENEARVYFWIAYNHRYFSGGRGWSRTIDLHIISVTL